MSLDNKKITWGKAEQMIREAYNLGKQVARNPDYYSLSNPLSDLISKFTKENFANGIVRTFKDSTGMTWTIKKESIQNYSYYIAESIDGNGSIREKLLRNVLSTLKQKYGTFEEK